MTLYIIQLQTSRRFVSSSTRVTQKMVSCNRVLATLFIDKCWAEVHCTALYCTVLHCTGVRSLGFITF